MPEPGRRIQFLYTNYRGEAGIRTAIPDHIYWGKTDYHPTEQWLLRGFDVDKNDHRTFALKDCIFGGFNP